MNVAVLLTDVMRYWRRLSNVLARCAIVLCMFCLSAFAKDELMNNVLRCWLILLRSV